MHRWIGTDNGSQCFVCGLVIDYLTMGEDDRPDPAYAAADRIASDRAHLIAFPFCAGPTLNRAHHLVYVGPIGGAAVGIDGDYLDCAYGDCDITPETIPGTVTLECIGG